MGANRRIALVFNKSKSPRRLQRFRDACEAEGIPITIYPTQDLEDVERQARRAAEDRADLLIAAGGDGTVLGVLRGARAAGSQAALAVLPLGTGNDFAKAIGIRDDRQLLDALRAGESYEVDLGLCEYVGVDGRAAESVFCSSAGVGVSAGITQIERSRSMIALKATIGQVAFVLASAWQICTYRGGPAAIWYDGHRSQRSVSLFEVTKVPSIGGFPLTPKSRPESGRLDCIAFNASIPRQARFLWSLLRSSGHISWPDVDYFSDDPATNSPRLANLREIAIEPSRRTPVHVHGEFSGFAPARFTLLRGALRVLAPPS